MGIITLSDILRYIIGRTQIGDINEVAQEVKKSTSDPTLKKSSRSM
jgi:CBS domain containing-hemolysin-like protein